MKSKYTWAVDTFIIFSIAVLLGTMFQRYQPYGLVWNATPSIPEGLYLSKDVLPGEPLRREEVVCWRHGELGRLMDRGYVEPKIRVCKPVMGFAGDLIEAEEGRVTLKTAQGTLVASVAVSAEDSKGRPLPNALQGLTAVPDGTVVVLAADQVKALDSRYLGPVPTTMLTKRLKPLWLK